MNITERNDPLRYADELRDALIALPETISRHLPVGGTTIEFGDSRWHAAKDIAAGVAGVRENALVIVSSLGFCRVYGLPLPSDIKSTLSSPLPPEVLVPAIDATLEMLASATHDARSLPERFDNSEPPEDLSHSTSLLHVLMKCWAVYVVVDDEFQLHLCAHYGDQSLFRGWLRRLLDALDTLDEQLQQDEQIRLLSIVTELPLLENWRKMLVDPYRELPPWWLDGTLEAAAEEVRQFIEDDWTFGLAATRPRSKAIAMLAQRDQEIASTAASFALAASAGEVTGPAADSLLHKTWSVAGDSGVQVRLELRPDQSNQRLLVVELIGPAEKTDEYDSVELGFRTEQSRSAPLQLGWTSLPLDQHEIQEIESLTVVDQDGNRHQVDLEELSNGE